VAVAQTASCSDEEVSDSAWMGAATALREPAWWLSSWHSSNGFVPDEEVGWYSLSLSHGHLA